MSCSSLSSLLQKEAFPLFVIVAVSIDYLHANNCAEELIIVMTDEMILSGGNEALPELRTFAKPLLTCKENVLCTETSTNTFTRAMASL